MNNSFFDTISQICGTELGSLVGGYKYAVFNGNTAVIEGHRGILTYDSDGIAFSFGKQKLVVHGQKLSIKCFQKNFAVVVGQIFAIKVVQSE